MKEKQSYSKKRRAPILFKIKGCIIKRNGANLKRIPIVNEKTPGSYGTNNSTILRAFNLRIHYFLHYK